MISPVSYSNYQRTYSIQNNSLNINNQISFKNITKHPRIVEQSTGEIARKALKVTGAALLTGLGIKSAKEIALDNDFKKITDERNKAIDREFYEGMSKYQTKIKKAYKRNPELVKELMLSQIKQEHNCCHNSYDTTSLEYSHSAIALIEEYSQKHPELTELYKKCLSNSYVGNFESSNEALERELLGLVTQNPEATENLLYKAGYKDSKNYNYNEHYYPNKLFTELKYYEQTNNTYDL